MNRYYCFRCGRNYTIFIIKLHKIRCKIKRWFLEFKIAKAIIKGLSTKKEKLEQQFKEPKIKL